MSSLAASESLFFRQQRRRSWECSDADWRGGVLRQCARAWLGMVKALHARFPPPSPFLPHENEPFLFTLSATQLTNG